MASDGHEVAQDHSDHGGHSGGHGPIAVYAAMVANFLIAVSKFTAAAFTGSSAMISEGVHSLADTGNQALLLLGINLSDKPPDAKHPFGRGKELYFWSLIVAVILFGVGGGVSFYEGVTHLQHPSEIRDPTWNYVVLGLAVIFESVAFYLALRELLRGRRKGHSFFKAVRESKDPAVFVVLFEDAAALAGLLVAFVGVWLSHRLGDPVIDAIASMIIGVILAAVAVFLAYESRGLLLGESADPEIVDSIQQIAAQDGSVERAKRALTMHFGPNNVLLNLTIVFKQGLSGKELAETLDRLEQSIRKRHPQIRQIFIEADAVIESEPEAATHQRVR